MESSQLSLVQLVARLDEQKNAATMKAMGVGSAAGAKRKSLGEGDSGSRGGRMACFQAPCGVMVCDLLFAAVKPEFHQMLLDGGFGYVSRDMHAGMDKAGIQKWKHLLLELVKIDSRGGVFKQSDTEAALNMLASEPMLLQQTKRAALKCSMSVEKFIEEIIQTKTK